MSSVSFLVYLYHEVAQLFRKEARDFCVLQCEGQEGSKYVLSMNSIEWPGCERSEETQRGKVRPF